MASSIFSYSLISTFKSPNYGSMMSSTATVSGLNNPSLCLKLPPTLAPISGRMMSTTTAVSGLNNPTPCLKLPPILAPISGRMMSRTTVSCLDNPSPCLMLPPTLEGFCGKMVYNFYDLAQNKIINFNNNKIPGKVTKIVGSSHGWLALLDELNGGLILTNPVTRRNVMLPPSQQVYKVIISCDAEQDECQAMMIGDSRRLAFCRPGRSPTEWTPIGALWTRDDYPRYYDDLVYSSRHKLFFCVTGDDLEGWDVASDPPKLCLENRDDLLGYEKYQAWLGRAGELLGANKGLRCETFKYLVFVEQEDQLFLVTRHLVRQMAPDGSAVDDIHDDSYPYKTVSFDVHRIDWELDGEGGRLSHGGGRLSHVDGGSLGGLAMFVGVNHSFALSATEANGLKPKSIYFTDDNGLTPTEWDNDSKFGGHDIGIFDYENKTISPCYYPCDLQSYKKIMPAPIWLTPSHN